MAADAASLIREHEKGGPNYAALDSVRTLRNQHLAHRQTRRVGTIQEDKLQEEVERLYQVSAKLISLLEHVVERTAYNPTEAAGIYKYYAEFFWEAVRGERSEGHPRYRPMPQT
jgi:hypothetical protein